LCNFAASVPKNNPDLVAPLLADKIIGTGTTGKVSKKDEMLADAKGTKHETWTMKM
jgi:hypothetical protein